MRNDEKQFREKVERLQKSMTEMLEEMSAIKEKLDKTEPKTIDMSCLVGSDIDCEFSDFDDFSTISKLLNIERHEYVDDHITRWKYCRPRLNHIHYCEELPELPEGLDVELYVVRAGYETRHVISPDLYHKVDYLIIGFRILGTLDGYNWEWE